MSNLDSLVSKITEDSKAKAKAIVDEANAAAEKIIKSKVAAAETQSEQILTSAKLEAARTKEQIISGKKLEVRDGKLKAKQDVINKTFAQAVERMKQLPEQDFVKFLTRYLMMLEVEGDETIVLPKKYAGIDINAVNEKLKANKRRGELVLAQNGKDIDGGFILMKGGIENNNTYESLLDYYRAELEVTVTGSLF